MELIKIERDDKFCALVVSDEIVIRDLESSLDLLMEVKYKIGTKNIAIDKKLICEEFFSLSTLLAGTIIQKYINYGARLAIYGDFSHYKSKALKDFIYESNKGHEIFFVKSKKEAVDKLLGR